MQNKKAIANLRDDNNTQPTNSQYDVSAPGMEIASSFWRQDPVLAH